MVMKGREIVIGVTGGIAAYKTAALVSRLVQDGAGVTAILTEAAKEFVGPDDLRSADGAAAAARDIRRSEFSAGGAYRTVAAGGCAVHRAGDGQFLGESGHRHGRRFAKHAVFSVPRAGDRCAGDECRDVVATGGAAQRGAIARRWSGHRRSGRGLAELPRRGRGADGGAGEDSRGD